MDTGFYVLCNYLSCTSGSCFIDAFDFAFSLIINRLFIALIAVTTDNPNEPTENFFYSKLLHLKLHPNVPVIIISSVTHYCN